MFLQSREHTTDIHNEHSCYSIYAYLLEHVPSFLKGSRLAPGSNLSRDIWTHACVDKIPQPDSAHQSKHIRRRLQKKKMCTALKVSTHGLYHPDEDDSSQDSSRCMKLPCFHSSFLPQTRIRQMRVCGGSDLPL